MIAILLENHSRYYELAWAADRSGLYYTCLSTRIPADEAGIILADSGARVLFTSTAMSGIARAILPAVSGIRAYSVDGPLEGFEDYLAARQGLPALEIADQSRGSSLLYSSGTTGRPKGIEVTLPEGPVDQIDQLTRIRRLTPVVTSRGGGPGSTSCSPACRATRGGAPRRGRSS